MKTIFKYMAVLLAGSLALGSCSKDYLDTVPTDSTSPTTAFATTENAAQAINGICEMMTTQHQYYQQGFNGEGTIKLIYGEYPGNDFCFPQYAPGWSPIMNQTYMQRTTSIYLHYPWYYYYILVSNANSVIAHIHEAAGEEADREFIKAQALTFRAYAYTMLVQLYAHRWCDSDNGASDGVVLRLDESTGGLELSSLAKCYERIYEDLDEAIELYTSSGRSRSNFWEPDLSVAYAVYARAALNREDWPTAQAMAPKAYAAHPLMSVAEYRSGFCEPNDEWIWGTYGSANENIWYYAHGVTMGYNGDNAGKGYGIIANRELIDLFPATDIRKNLFLHQELFPEYNFTDNSETGPVEDFYGIVTDEFAYGPDASDSGKALRKAMSEYANSVAAYKPAYDAAYYYIYGHLKFAVTAQPGVSNINHFRSSEMYLTEAEAAYHNNDIPAAQAAMNALNRDSQRDPSYSCTATGEALLTEIRNYRRLELWGEGFSWFDYKRWNLPIERKSFEKGGTFQSSVAVTIQPGDANQWTWDIPLREVDYNDVIK